MNRRAGTEHLLADVFVETASADFRAAALAETLRAARRRQQIRQSRNGVGILCALILLAIFLGKNFLKPSTISTPQANAITKPSYELVRTQPLPKNDVVGTEALAAAHWISSSATVAEIATARGNYRYINDAELLALVAGKPAILIRTGPDSEELVFARPEDRKDFPAN